MISKNDKVVNFAKSIRKKILTTAYHAGAKSAHVGGALSCVELISSLFVNYNLFNPENLKDDNRDRFILSKGHACLAYYSALNEVGLISNDEMKTFEEDGSNLLGHPVANKDLGIEFSTGSLGMGLSIGIGLAIASQKKNFFFKTFVILGDGECNEGSVWEAAMAAPNLKVKNFLAIIDKNKFQQTGANSEIMNIDPIEDKWKAFGWNVKTLNGHDIPSILSYFETIDFEKPNLLVANTIKGKGFSFSENNNDWHHGTISKKIYEEALNEIEKT